MSAGKLVLFDLLVCFSNSSDNREQPHDQLLCDVKTSITEHNVCVISDGDFSDVCDIILIWV